MNEADFSGQEPDDFERLLEYIETGNPELVSLNFAGGN